jgi:predicted O-methyltransferase YrrM
MLENNIFTFYEHKPSKRRLDLKIDLEKISKVKGFLDEEEARRLYLLADEASRLAPCLEVGSYCGKSAVFLGTACKENNAVLFSIDHHSGSEEQQPGEEYFDPELLDKETGKIDTLGFFRRTIDDFDLGNTVVPIIGRSEIVGRAWSTKLGLVFIDGGHAYDTVLSDYEIWSRYIVAGGYLVFHDIFPDPADGGQAPYLVYQKAAASALFDVEPLFKSLGILKRKG